MPQTPRFSTTRTRIAGIPISELVERFATPLYVYDAARILERIDDLRAFDVVRYAQKANSNLTILDLMRRQGVLVDAVSAGEIRRALAAGYQAEGTPPPIVFTADIFDRQARIVAWEQEIHVNCGSPDMIDQWGAVSPGSSITLRINPGFGHGHSQKTNTGGEQSKHGIWHEQLSEALQRARRFDLKVSGLHMHIGSGTDLDHLAQVCDAMERAARRVGPSIHSISAGGGLPVPYDDQQDYVDLDRYYRLWNATRQRLEQRFAHPVSLEIEPGRYLVAESGYLITEIRAIKSMGDNRFYLVDAGFHNLARPILYGAYHPMALAVDDDDRPRPEQEVVVGGPLCESGDIFTQSEGGFVRRQRLPEAQVGEFLVIEVAGAYGQVMASNYNSQPLAAEVLIHQGQPFLIRARQTFEDLVRGETKGMDALETGA